MTDIAKRALKAGSSKQGKARRASVGLELREGVASPLGLGAVQAPQTGTDRAAETEVEGHAAGGQRLGEAKDDGLARRAVDDARRQPTASHDGFRLVDFQLDGVQLDLAHGAVEVERHALLALERPVVEPRREVNGVALGPHVMWQPKLGVVHQVLLVAHRDGPRGRAAAAAAARWDE